MTTATPTAFHVLAKPTGAICNLDCKYCFFLSKEMLYPGSRFHMADELLEIYLKQLLDAHDSPEVTIAWQGGEPGLNYLCAGYKMFFKHVDRPMRMMAGLLRRGHYADEVMQILTGEETAKLQPALAASGRNDPCPCGSGKKFKRCHGVTDSGHRVSDTE